MIKWTKIKNGTMTKSYVVVCLRWYLNNINAEQRKERQLQTQYFFVSQRGNNCVLNHILSLRKRDRWETFRGFYLWVFVPSLLQAFVEVCMKHNNKYEAKKYVSKVTPEQKVKAYLAVR